jgi:ATP-dependent RNA helicase RhlE
MNYQEKRSPRSDPGKRRGRPGHKPFRKGTRRPNPNVDYTPASESERKYRKAEPMDAISMNGAFNALIPEIQHALKSEGYEIPTPVQEQAISPQVEGRDVLGSAQTGTGKTAAFTLPLLQQISVENFRAESRRPRALILTPTRELAAQIGDSLATYGRHLPVTHTVIFGGVKQSPQERAMNRGVDIVVATPGRLIDLMNQGFVKLDGIETFILDEVDRMLDMGFIPDIKRILEKIPRERRTGFFSATLPPKILSLAETMVTNAVKVTINPEQLTIDKIRQRLLYVDKRDKDKLLVSIFDEDGVDRVIVFTQMKHVANRVCQKLQKAGIRAAAIHGNRSQAQRTQALHDFRNGKVKVLVATDIAARGIDVDGISDVINYDLPLEPENYIHRIGRTARAGSNGQSWSFCTTEDNSLLRNIERLLKTSIPLHTDHRFHSEAVLRSLKESPRSSGGGNYNKGGRGRRYSSPSNFSRSPGRPRGRR